MNSRIRTRSAGRDVIAQRVSDFCDATGKSRATVYRWMRGDGVPQGESKKRLDAAGVTVEAPASFRGPEIRRVKLGRPPKHELVLVVRASPETGRGRSDLIQLRATLEELGFCVGDRSGKERAPEGEGSPENEETTPETMEDNGQGAIEGA